MFDRPILIYSEYCQFSEMFLKTLMKHPELFDSFIRMCIDVNPQTKKRPAAFYQIQQKINKKISTVPVIITPDGTNILSDKEAFKWLEYQIQTLSKNTELLGFNKNEMTSLSDSYAKYGSTDINDATEQSFQFFKNKQLPDDNYLNTTKSWDPNSENTGGFLNDMESSHNNNANYATKQNERQHFDESRQQTGRQLNPDAFKDKYNQSNVNQNDFNAYSQQRQGQGQGQGQGRQNIDFTNPNFGLSGKLESSNQHMNSNSQKGTELNKRLDQLMQDRELTDNALQRR